MKIYNVEEIMNHESRADPSQNAEQFVFYNDILSLAKPEFQDAAEVKRILEGLPPGHLLTFIDQHQYDSMKDFHAYMTMGRVLQKMQQHDDALKIYRKMHPFFTVKLTISRCLQEMGQFDEASSILHDLEKPSLSQGKQEALRRAKSYLRRERLPSTLTPILPAEISPELSTSTVNPTAVHLEGINHTETSSGLSTSTANGRTYTHNPYAFFPISPEMDARINEDALYARGYFANSD